MEHIDLPFVLSVLHYSRFGAVASDSGELEPPSGIRRICQATERGHRL